MAYGLARRELRPRVPLRPGEGEKHHLTSLEGLAALSLDALGSRHTQARRAADLAEAGLDETHLGRIHGPIGLDLGARTPAETALSVCAEVLATLDGREPRPAG